MSVEIVTENSVGEASVARSNRKAFDDARVFVVNVIGSAGCGKTSLLLAILRGLGHATRVGVITAHPTSHKDADRMAALAGRVVHVSTVEGQCLTAGHARGILDRLDLSKLDLLLVENLSSLVGPCDHDLGEHRRVAVFSVAGGDDKLTKYAHVVAWADVLLLNKTDLLASFPFDLDRFRDEIRRINPQTALFEVSALTGDGLAPFLAWLRWQSHKGPSATAAPKQASTGTSDVAEIEESR